MPEAPTSTGRRIGRAAMSNALLVPAQGVLTLLATALIARSLGLDRYAIFAIFNAVRSSLLFYTDLGVSTAGSKFFPEVIEQEGRRGARRLLLFQAQVNLATAVVWIAILEIGGAYWSHLLGIPAADAYLLRCAQVALAVEEAGRIGYVFLWARFAQHKVNVANLIATAVQPALIAAAVVAHLGLPGIIGAVIVTACIRAVLLWHAVVRELRAIEERPDAPPVPKLYRRFMQVGAASWFEKLSGYVYGNAFLTLALATRLDKQSLAQLALAMEFTVRFLSLVLSPTHGIILPAVASVFAARNHDVRQRVFTVSLRALALWLAPMAALLVTTAPLVIPWAYTRAFEPAVLLVQVLAVFYFLEYAVYSPANSVLIAGERLRSYSLAKAVSIVAFVPFVFAAGRLSLLAIAAIYGALRLGAALLLLWRAAQSGHFTVPLAFYGRLLPLIGAAVLAGIAAQMADAGPAAIALIAALGCAGVLAGYRVLRLVGPLEREVVEQLHIPGGAWLVRAFQP